MAHIVVLGAGLGGMPAAYDLRATAAQAARDHGGQRHRLTSSSRRPTPGWRWAGAIATAVTLPIAAACSSARASPSSARPSPRSTPRAAVLTLEGGQTLAYDYLVITTGPKLSFDEVPGAGPHGGHTHSVCTVPPCRDVLPGVPEVPAGAGAGGHRRDAGGQLLRPGLRVRVHPRHRPAPAQAAPQGADHLRHHRAVHRPPRAGRRRRQQVACSSPNCAATTSSGSPTPRPPRSRPGKLFTTQLDDHGQPAARSTKCRSSWR